MIRRSASHGPKTSVWMRLLTDEKGATATEYGILMSFIVMLTAIGITFFGLELLGWFDDLTAHLKLVLGIP